MTATARAEGAAVAPSAPRTSGIRRVGSALAMVLAPWGFFTANTAYALAIRDGGNEDTGADTLALWGAHDLLVHVATVGGMLGCLLIVPAVVGAFRLAPTSRLALIGGSLMVAGYVCYFGVLASGFSIMAMAAADPASADFAAVIDNSQADPWGVWVFLLFVVGNLIGTMLFASGLLRSRRVPTWAALGIMSWPPLHVVGLVFFGNEVPQVIGAVLQAVGFAGCAVALLRGRGGAEALGQSTPAISSPPRRNVGTERLPARAGQHDPGGSQAGEGGDVLGQHRVADLEAVPEGWRTPPP